MASTFDPKGRNFMENAMDKVMEYLKQAKGAWYLATVEDGQPRVRPFGAQVVYNGRLYIQTSNKKKVYAQLKAEPRFEICAFIDGANGCGCPARRLRIPPGTPRSRCWMPTPA